MLNAYLIFDAWNEETLLLSHPPDPELVQVSSNPSRATIDQWRSRARARKGVKSSIFYIIFLILLKDKSHKLTVKRAEAAAQPAFFIAGVVFQVLPQLFQLRSFWPKFPLWREEHGWFFRHLCATLEHTSLAIHSKNHFAGQEQERERERKKGQNMGSIKKKKKKKRYGRNINERLLTPFSPFFLLLFSHINEWILAGSGASLCFVNGQIERRRCLPAIFNRYRDIVSSPRPPFGSNCRSLSPFFRPDFGERQVQVSSTKQGQPTGCSCKRRRRKFHN